MCVDPPTPRRPRSDHRCDKPQSRKGVDRSRRYQVEQARGRGARAAISAPSGARLRTAQGRQDVSRALKKGLMTTKPKGQETVRLRKFIERLYGEGIVRGEDGPQHSISPARHPPDRGPFI